MDSEIDASVRDMNVLVTGGEGFVGGAVIDALIREFPDFRLTSTDLKPRFPAGEKDRVAFVQADVLDAVQLEDVFAQVKPNVVVHTAGIVPRGPARYNRVNEKMVFDLNAGGTKNVVEAAKKFGVAALVYTSTCCIVTDDYNHEYPNYDETAPIPKSSLTYGESKAVAEKIVLEANSDKLLTCALRPSVILGPGDYQLIPAIHACISKGETPYLIGGGTNLYDFTYIDNIAHAHILAIRNLLSTRTAAGEAISISNGQPVTFRDFCLAVWSGFDHVPGFTIRIPGKLAWLAGLASECVTWLTGSPSTLSRGSVNDALGTRYANISKARKLLGYEPIVDLVDGVRLSCQAYKKVLATRTLKPKTSQ